MTVFGLFFFLFSCILAAFAVDVSNLYSQRTHLQTAADQAGHAALYRLWTSNDPASSDNQAGAIDDARSIARYSLPRARTGGAIADEDIQIVFGDWNPSTQTFAPGVGYSAVRVETSFRGTNAVASFFFRFIGKNAFTVSADSVWDAEPSGCFTDGFIAQGALDINSNMEIGGEFCFVSNTEVTRNQNNQWGDFNNGVLEERAIVIMPEGTYNEAVADGGSGNPGWLEALGYADTPIPLLPLMQNMMYDEVNPLDSTEVETFFDNGRPYANILNKIDMPSYITELSSDQQIVRSVPLSNGNNSVNRLTPLTLVAAGMDGPGVYHVTCPNNGTLNIDMDPENDAYMVEDATFIEDMVIITTCKLDFAQGSVIESGRFIVLNDDTSGSISAASGVTFGRADFDNPDGCEASETVGDEIVRAPGVQIYTMGDAHFPAAFDGYGLQLIAMGDVSMASGGGGTNAEAPKDFIGSSIISGGEISLTTQMNIKIGCYPVGDAAVRPPLYRMRS
jgi:hypothetical protein